MSTDMTIYGGAQTEIFCSMNPEDDAGRKTLLNAMANPDYKLSDFINQEIVMKDLITEMVDMTSEDGEVKPTPRIVIIDDKGKSYQCMSWGIFNVLKRFMVVYGEPTWGNGIKVRVVQVQNKERKMLSLKVC